MVAQVGVETDEVDPEGQVVTGVRMVEVAVVATEEVVVVEATEEVAVVEETEEVAVVNVRVATSSVATVSESCRNPHRA